MSLLAIVATQEVRHERSAAVTLLYALLLMVFSLLSPWKVTATVGALLLPIVAQVYLRIHNPSRSTTEIVLLTAFTVLAVYVGFRLTRQRHAMHELQRARQLEMAGRLAGRVGHEINNSLTTILSATDIIIGDYEQEHPHRAVAAEIRRAVEESSLLTRQLLFLAQRKIGQPREIDLCNFLREREGELRYLIRPPGRLQLDLARETAAVSIDPEDLMQLLVCLLQNAADTRGDVTTTIGVDGDGSVRLRVADNGEGIADEIRERATEPFVTTKGSGRGLGLATVHDIVEMANGKLQIESGAEGTTVTVLLPQAAEPVAAQMIPGSGEDCRTGVEPQQILLVDDNPGVRLLVSRQLRDAGYQVTVAAHPHEAIRLLSAHCYAALVTDVVMPEMTAVDLVNRVREMQPELSVLLISGFVADDKVRMLLEAGQASFLAKPFSTEQLKAALAALVGAAELIIVS